MTPVMGAQLSLPAINVPTVAKVTLAGFDSPISELLGSLILGGQLLFSTDTDVANNDLWGPTAFQIPPTAPNVVPPYPNDQTGTSAPVFPAALETDELGAYTSIGVLPNFIDFALPIVRQLGINGSDYLNVSVFGLSAAGVALSEGLWNAAGELLTLQFQAALATLANSISAAGTLALASGAYVLSGVVTRAQAVIEAVIGALPLALGAGVAQISLVVNESIAVITDTFNELGTGNFEGAWNAAIDGLFGATGIPGTLLNVTIGAGQQTGPIEYGDTPPFTPTTDSIAANYVPSVRTVAQSAIIAVANALATPVPVSPPTASVEAPAASAASARAAAVEAAPAAEAPAADSSEAAPAAEAAEAPAAEVAAPKPARKAARAVRPSA
jgi:hypothetical protein